MVDIYCSCIDEGCGRFNLSVAPRTWPSTLINTCFMAMNTIYLNSSIWGPNFAQRVCKTGFIVISCKGIVVIVTKITIKVALWIRICCFVIMFPYHRWWFGWVFVTHIKSIIIIQWVYSGGGGWPSMRPHVAVIRGETERLYVPKWWASSNSLKEASIL